MTAADAVPAQIEVESLASQQRITEDAARGQLRIQRSVPVLADAAKEQLGSKYGGLWVDGSRVKLAVSSGQAQRVSAADGSRAAAVVKQVGLVGNVDLVPATYSESDLTDLQRQLDEGLATVNASAPVTVDAESDVKTGSVRLVIPPAPTAEQATFVAEAQKRYGSKISTGSKPGALQRTACASGAYCDPPLRGAIRLIYGGSGICSSGFVTRSLSDGIRFLSTAGHCVSGNYATWSTHFSDGSSHDIGVPHNFTNDFGILRINNPSGWGNPGPYIRIQSDQTYRISGYGSSAVGQRICMSGGFTDSNCATVTGGLATRDGTPNTYRASYCAGPGDSGGSVFASNNAYGSVVGKYAQCDQVYFSAAAFSTLNVVPVTQ